MMLNRSNILQNNGLANVTAQVQSVLQVILFAAVVVSVGIGWWRYQNVTFIMTEPKSVSDHVSPDMKIVESREIQPLSFYTQLVEQRNIFRFSPVDPPGIAMQSENVTVPHQDLMGRYTVQGIVYDHNPMTIIKDNQTQKTYFLHRYEMLEDAKLIDIRENRVIFNRGGETLELIKK